MFHIFLNLLSRNDRHRLGGHLNVCTNVHPHADVHFFQWDEYLDTHLHFPLALIASGELTKAKQSFIEKLISIQLVLFID